MTAVSDPPVDEAGLRRYDAAAVAAAALVLRRYSTSFGLATRLLAPPMRPHIAAVYGLVRIADEIVDGTAAEAGLDLAAQRRVLDELESDTERALESGFSANLVVHAFAATARRAGITRELTRPFFASMRRDLDPVDFSDEEYRSYIHGSAEVVGLMCLNAFLVGHELSPAERKRLEAGAIRLGAAFQKINFLRDLADDGARLERAYFPGAHAGEMNDDAKAAAVAEIRDDLAAARAVIPELPIDCRRAVASATGLFGELLRRLERVPAAELFERRVSVPAPVKARILLAACVAPGRAGR